MPGLPSFPFYPGDWMKDPALRQCSLATRGAWIDLICFIHEHGTEGKIQSTPMRLSRYCGCLPGEMMGCLKELSELGVCEVELSNDRDPNAPVTVFSRRMQRDEKKREQARDRQRRFREKQEQDSSALHNAGSNAKKTGMSEEESEEENEEGGRGEGAGRGETPADSPAEDSPPPAGWSMEWDPEFQHHPAVIAFSETFPSQRLTQRQREMIGTAIGTVPDRVALWRTTTLARWDVNDYSARNIFDLIRSFGQDLSTQKARASPGARRPLTVPEAATDTPATVTPDKLPYQPPPPVGSVDRIGKLDQIERFGTTDDDYTEIQTSEGTRWMPSLEAMQRMEAIKRRAS